MSAAIAIWVVLSLGQSSGSAPRATLEGISALLQQQQVEAARDAADKALKSYPDDPVLHNLAGVIAAERGDQSAARTQFEQAIRLAPDLASAYENLGRLYQEQSATDPGATARALAVYGRLLALDPTNVEGLYQSAYLLANEGRFQDSWPLLARLPSALRTRPQVLALAAVDAGGTGDAARAAEAARALSTHPELTAADVLGLSQAFGHLSDDTPGRLLEALDKRQLATPEVLQSLGEWYLRRNRLQDARVTLERASAAGAPAVPVLISLARAADKLGDHQGALGYLAHARSIDPKNARVHFMFGVVCIELNLVREAYDALKQAVELAPEDPMINYAMGAVSMHRHEPVEALPYLEAYVRLKPEDPRGRFALGVGRFTAGQMDQAAADLREAAAHPETAGGAHYFLARIARQAGDLDTARKEIQESLRVVPGYADAWAEAGLIETRSGNFAAAQQALDKALQLDPENYLATVNLAALYTRTKDPRRDEQAAKLAALQQKREERAQDFLRIIEVVP
jgi:tetratricopeptide (TPR) repeat protein